MQLVVDITEEAASLFRQAVYNNGNNVKEKGRENTITGFAYGSDLLGFGMYLQCGRDFLLNILTGKAISNDITVCI